MPKCILKLIDSTIYVN